jgi:hypothetical protein
MTGLLHLIGAAEAKKWKDQRRESKNVFFTKKIEFGSADGVLSPVVQGEQRLREAEEERIRRETVERLWIITEELNILFKDNWTVLADKQMKSFQRQLREIEVKFKAKIIFFTIKFFV